jgi:hypothetical protein
VLVDLPVSAASPNPRRLLLGWWERRGQELLLLALPQFVHCVQTGDHVEELLNGFARPGAGGGELSNLPIDGPIDELLQTSRYVAFSCVRAPSAGSLAGGQ